MTDIINKLIHPDIKDSRVLTYLNIRNKPQYKNTEEETYLLQLWREKYYIAKSEYEKSAANSAQVAIWRNAFEGDFNKLDEKGNITPDKIKAIRKLAFELVESKVNARIPAPKMSPRYHADLTPVNATESLLKNEIDRMLTEEVNNESEHYSLIDGTVWFKVGWNPFDNTHERSGNPIVTACPVDTIFPQPGVKNYKELEYIFEEVNLTLAQTLDLYGREISGSTQNDLIDIVNCYFLNENRYVGKFSWCETKGIVLCNDLEWGIRKRRECKQCHTVCPIEDECPNCGGKHFEYVSVKEERVQEDLVNVENPYRSGLSPNVKDDESQIDEEETIPAGTPIPHYLIRQLPFVPYTRVMRPNSIYGMSEVEVVLENQDLINKLLNKAEKKSAKSRTYVTKMKDTNIDDDDDEVTKVEVEDYREGSAIQVKQVTSDISQEIAEANLMYDIGKSTSGVTNTDQGKEDNTARSGKAKQLQMAASAQRNKNPENLRNLAFSGVYELIFKNLLAYSDEVRSFVTLLPDGTQTEQVWSKYMFLAKDKFGNYYYKDDYAWSVDTASEITQDRAAMWQMIDNDFLNGTLGTSVDPTRALLMYWQMKEQTGYPLAKYAIAFLKESVQHLPTQVEQALMNNPEALQLALSFMKDQQEMAGVAAGGGQGGARVNAGREGNGATHAANVEKTNNTNRSASGAATTNTTAAKTGGMQGGVAND